jgi:hypothetical protein
MVKPNPSKQHNLPQTNTMHALKEATININDITAPTKVRMIANFTRRHEIDLMLVQKATNTDTLNFGDTTPTLISGLQCGGPQ